VCKLVVLPEFSSCGLPRRTCRSRRGEERQLVGRGGTRLRWAVGGSHLHRVARDHSGEGGEEGSGSGISTRIQFNSLRLVARLMPARMSVLALFMFFLAMSPWCATGWWFPPPNPLRDACIRRRTLTLTRNPIAYSSIATASIATDFTREAFVLFLFFRPGPRMLPSVCFAGAFGFRRRLEDVLR